MFATVCHRNSKDANAASIRLQSVMLLLLFSLLLPLVGCQRITRQVGTVNWQPSNYPFATLTDPSLKTKPPRVNLSHYRSVQLRSLQNPDLAVAVAVSGGGYRAANLATGVLLGLEKTRFPGIRGNLLQEVDYFSTVSGGGFAIGLYLSHLYQYILQHGNENVGKFRFSDFIEHNVYHYQTSSHPIANVLNHDLTENLFSRELMPTAIEQKFDRSFLYLPDRTMRLADIFVSQNSHRPVLLPYWVINASIFQTAETFQFTPDMLKRYQIRGYWHHNQKQKLLGDLQHSHYGFDLPVSVALTASAGFPLAVPLTVLESTSCKEPECFLMLLDGGVADNLGVFSALELLKQDSAKNKLLIVIDAAQSWREPFSRKRHIPSDWVMLWRISNASLDAPRGFIRRNINDLVHDMLCRGKTEQVLVAYLNLDDYPGTHRIGSGLYIKPEDQLQLLEVGEKLATTNPVLTVDLPRLLSSKKQSRGLCR